MTAGRAPLPILVVEDDPDVRGALAALLEVEGYEVVEAADGSEALRRLRSGAEVSLILLDLFMPHMDGWQFRDEQRKDPRLADIPVIVLTADASAARRVAGSGVVAAMTKPVEFDRLLGLVRDHC